MKLLCIDPGTESSGVVVFDTETSEIDYFWAEIGNFQLLNHMPDADHLAIEMVESFGMAVGREVFETCVWIGRFIQKFPGEKTLVYRGQVKDMLCRSRRATDSNIRQALLDKYPRTGGGKTPQVGVKNNPGPLYGIKKHAWSALAVGHAWVSLRKDKS